MAHRKYSPQEQLALLNELACFDGSIEIFCQQKGITSRTIRLWRKNQKGKRVLNEEIGKTENQPTVSEITPASPISQIAEVQQSSIVLTPTSKESSRKSNVSQLEWVIEDGEWYGRRRIAAEPARSYMQVRLQSTPDISSPPRPLPMPKAPSIGGIDMGSLMQAEQSLNQRYAPTYQPRTYVRWVINS